MIVFILKIIRAYLCLTIKQTIDFILISMAYSYPNLLLLFLSDKDLIIKQATILIDGVCIDKTILLNFIYKYRLFSDSSDSCLLDEMTKWFNFDHLIYDYLSSDVLVKKNIIHNQTDNTYSYLAGTSNEKSAINFNRLSILN